MLAYQRGSTQKKSRNPELSGGIGISKQPKSVSGAIPEPSWNDMRIHYRSNNLPGTDGLATPGAAAMVDLGTAAVAEPGTTAVAEPETTAVAEPETTAVVELGTAAVAEPGTTAVAESGTAAVAEPGTTAVAEPGAAMVVQMVRKRVKGIENTFADTDIYFDKSDNHYYNDMTPEGKDNVTVSQVEYLEFDNISSTNKRTPKTTILAEAHKGADRKFVYYKPAQKAETVENPRAESHVEGPRAESHVEGPRAEGAVEGQRAESPVDGPRAESAVEGLRAEGHVEGQRAESHVEGQRAEGAVEGPRAESHVEGQRAEGAVEGQRAEGAVEGPRAESPVDGPRAESAVEGLRAEGDGAGAQAADITVTGDIFSVGSVLATEPKAVRLYAEGNMRHAASLASAFGISGKYNQFIEMDRQMNPEDNDVSTPEVLIKATEYDPLGNLDGRYGDKSQENTLARVKGKERLEVSFGGRTGNMSRELMDKGTPKRLYDIIQATFFWIPEFTNDQNFNMLKGFMMNQRAKLKDGGKIRIVLANKDTLYLENYNHYRQTANNLICDRDLNQLFNMRKIVLKERKRNRRGQMKTTGQTYADRLKQMGMNSENFQHTRTDTPGVVEAYSDLLIEATPKD